MVSESSDIHNDIQKLNDDLVSNSHLSKSEFDSPYIH